MNNKVYPMKFIRFNRAFTLIELLVVIAIVGVLSGFIFVSMTSAINSAKDAKRKADLSSIEKALLVYGANHGGTYPYSALDTYPCNLTGSTNLCTNTNLSSALSPYLGVLPTDPNGTSYTYTGVADASSFVLTGTLSNGNSYYYSSPNLTWTETTSPFVGWGYKKTITLSAGLTQDYQIKLTIPFGAGGCESHCNANFSDLRFASTSGTVLNYWIESYTASTAATVWVKALNGSSSLNMYYGKTGTTTTANGDNTFEFFDDFTGSTINSAKWSVGGSHPVSNSILTVTYSSSTSPYWIIRSIDTFGVNYALRVNAKFTSLGSYANFAFSSTDISYPYDTGVYMNYPTANVVNFFSRNPHPNTAAVNAGTVTTTDYHIYDVKRNGTVADDFAIDNVNKGSNSTSVPVGTYGLSFFGQSQSYYVDWVLVRKYQSSEPTPSYGGEASN
jgi:prepilin-type N-terminal cleavage/methylation domain-containing protein